MALRLQEASREAKECSFLLQGKVRLWSSGEGSFERAQRVLGGMV